MNDLHPQQRPPVAEGEVLADKYRVDKVIGVGGMGVVVAATHIELDQKVALKFLLPHAAASPSHVERFLREGKAAVRLKSEHVARVLDVGRMKDGVPYIVMEYLEGQDLSGTVRARGALPIDEAVGYVLQACDGVAEAHAAKIIHRDLKPDNLFVTARNDGQPLVKVLDFGISKTLDTNAVSLTQTDSMVGSPAYMSPEQMRSSKNVDERSDIWSLGVILYELLTGRLPYIAESLPALAFQLAEHDAPPASEFRPDLPDGLTRVVMQCLHRERDKRTRDVGTLAVALEPYARPQDKEIVKRILMILASPSRPPMGSVPEIVVVKSNPQLVTGGWGTTQAGSPQAKRSSRLRYILAGAAVVAVIAVGFLAQRQFFRATPDPAASGTSASQPAGSEKLAPSSQTPASQHAPSALATAPGPTALEPPPTVATAATAATASATTRAPASGTAATGTPTANAKPKPSGPIAPGSASATAPPAATSAKTPSTTDPNGFIHERQ